MEPSFSGLAGFTIEQLGDPTGLTTGNVVNWFKYSLGTLNSVFQVNYQPSGEFTTPYLDYAASGFYSKLYICQYLNKQAQQNLGAAAYDWSEIREGDSTVRRVSKNEQAKVYSQLSKECRSEVNDWATQYKISRALPLSVDGYFDNLVRYFRLDIPNG
jgi:hypothetical protein